MRSGRRSREFRAAWAGLGLRARLLILGVVFCMFAPLGVLGEIASTSSVAPTPWLLLEIIFTGLLAVALLEFTGRAGRWLLLIPVVLVLYFAARNVAPAFITSPRQLQPEEHVPAALEQEAAFGTLAVALLLYGSYAALMTFLATEGLRQVRLQAEIALAAEIHEALVPPINGRFGHLEVHAESQPSTEVGGDLFDVHVLDDDVVAYLADISGHGVPASSLAGMIKSAVRMRLRVGDRLALAVTALNELLIELTPPHVYATLIMLRVGERGAELCVAGHLPMLRFSLDGTVERYPASAPPAGLLSNASYESSELSIATGDLLVLFTDGLTEVEDVRNRQLGLDALEATIAEVRARPLAEIHSVVMKRVAQHGESHDDQTLVLLRVNRDSNP